MSSECLPSASKRLNGCNAGCRVCRFLSNKVLILAKRITVLFLKLTFVKVITCALSWHVDPRFGTSHCNCGVRPPFALLCCFALGVVGCLGPKLECFPRSFRRARNARGTRGRALKPKDDFQTPFQSILPCVLEEVFGGKHIQNSSPWLLEEIFLAQCVPAGSKYTKNVLAWVESHGTVEYKLQTSDCFVEDSAIAPTSSTLRSLCRGFWTMNVFMIRPVPHQQVVVANLLSTGNCRNCLCSRGAGLKGNLLGCSKQPPQSLCSPRLRCAIPWRFSWVEPLRRLALSRWETGRGVDGWSGWLRLNPPLEWGAWGRWLILGGLRF